MDTAIVAKTKRVKTKWEKFMSKMAKPKQTKPVVKPRTVRCKKCDFKVRSTNNQYIRTMFQRHMAEAHASR